MGQTLLLSTEFHAVLIGCRRAHLLLSECQKHIESFEQHNSKKNKVHKHTLHYFN